MRSIGYAMPWVRPPSEVYNTAFAVDGVDASYRFNAGDVAISSQVFYGYSDNPLLKIYAMGGVNVRWFASVTRLYSSLISRLPLKCRSKSDGARACTMSRISCSTRARTLSMRRSSKETTRAVAVPSIERMRPPRRLSSIAR